MNEQGSEEMGLLVGSVDPSFSFVFELTALEVRSALRRRERSGDLSKTNAAVALASLTAELGKLTLEPVSATILSAASRLIDSNGLRALDSIQLATALMLREKFPSTSIRFVASDHKLLQAASAEGLSIWNPGEDTLESDSE